MSSENDLIAIKFEVRGRVQGKLLLSLKFFCFLTELFNTFQNKLKVSTFVITQN